MPREREIARETRQHLAITRHARCEAISVDFEQETQSLDRVLRSVGARAQPTVAMKGILGQNPA